MPFNYYQGPQPDSLNPAYEMLFRAAEARRAQHLAIPGQVSDALDQYTRSKQTDRELDIRERGQNAETDLRQRDMGLREKTLERSMSQDEAFARAMAHISGLPDDMQHDPGPAGPAFGGRTAGTQGRGPVTAESILRGGMSPTSSEPDWGAMGPENASRFSSMQNTAIDNQRMADKERRGQETDASDARNYNTLIGNSKKQGILTDAEATAFQMRGVSPEGRRQAADEITKRITSKADEAGQGAKADATAKALIKQAKSDFKDDPDKLGQIAAQETLMSASALKGEDRAKAMQEWSDSLYGVKREPKTPRETDYTKDLPKDSLLRGPGTYALDPKTGDIVMPQAERAQLKLLARNKLANDIAFNSQMAGMVGFEPEPGKEIKFISDLKKMQADKTRDEELTILAAQGWTEQQKGSGLPFGGEQTSSATPAQQPSGSQGFNNTRSVLATTTRFDGLGNQLPGAPANSGATSQAPAAGDPLSGLSPEQYKQAVDLHKSGDKAKLREFLIDSRKTNAVGGESVTTKDWEKRNPKPKKSWFSNSTGQTIFVPMGIYSYEDALAEWEAAKKGNGGFGSDTSWAGMPPEVPFQ